MFTSGTIWLLTHSQIKNPQLQPEVPASSWLGSAIPERGRAPGLGGSLRGVPTAQGGGPRSAPTLRRFIGESGGRGGSFSDWFELGGPPSKATEQQVPTICFPRGGLFQLLFGGGESLLTPTKQEVPTTFLHAKARRGCFIRVILSFPENRQAK